MDECMVSGGWVILQNCHLGLGYMNDLLTIIPTEAEPEKAELWHDEFRLWITCESNNQFPLGLLQRAIKITNEAPKGIKAGLNKTFTTVINQDFLDKIEHPYWRQLIFTLCFQHSVVQERRKFGPLGWCVPYEFNNADLEASLQFVEKYLNSLMSGSSANMATLPVSIVVIQYMVVEIQYGGKITDNLDRELFITYGQEYVKEGIFAKEHPFTEI
jgi:dynein heavy chain